MPLEDIRQNRIEKLNKLKKLGIDPYPIHTNKNRGISEVVKDQKRLIKDQASLVLAGRIRTLRPHGGSIFCHIEEGGTRLQLFIKKDTLGDQQFKLFSEMIDVGDYIEAQGILFFTKTNELTLEVQKWQILTKSLLPLPDKWHGLQDKETRYRKRYLDLLSNPEFKERIKFRSNLIKMLRGFLEENGFMEVETPILQNQAGGALARPFKTKLNALNIDLYLRIAPELYLKELIIGGLEKVYEVAKCFRNEGIDFSHNPEFTQIEFYWAYCDYEKLMQFTEDMFRAIIKSFPKQALSQELGKYLDKSLPRLEYKELFKKSTGLDCDTVKKQELKALLEKEGIEAIEEGDEWTLIDEVFKKLCLKKINYPFFLIHHPLTLSPLAKKTKKNDKTVARFQLIIENMEIVNAYSELNDPVDQKERFEHQQERMQEGEKEVHPYDKDFVEALEYGMPPTAGWGMGIDRLVALLTGSPNLKEVILFPLMRPKKPKK